MRPLNGIELGDAIFFGNEDPQVSIIPPAGGKQLRLETSLQVVASTSLNAIEGLIGELAQATEKLLAERDTLKTKFTSSDHARIQAEAVAAKHATRCEELLATVSAQTQELEEMHDSISWRITQPLRAIKRIFTKGR